MALKRPSINADKYADEDAVKVPAKAKEAEEAEDVYEDEDPEETPKVGTNVQAGWAAAKKAYDEAPKGEYTGEFQWAAEPQLVKFVGDGPFAIYADHWLDNPPTEITKKKSHICLTSVGGDKCPLCAIGAKARPKWAFTVVTIDEDVSEPQMVVAGPKLFEILSAKQEARTGPLTKHYYALSRTGKGNTTAYFVDVVKASDLAEDWDLDPADVEEAVKDVEPLTGDALYVTKRSDLTEIARAIA